MLNKFLKIFIITCVFAGASTFLSYASNLLINTVNVGFYEANTEPGTIKYAEPRSSTNNTAAIAYRISDWSCSSDQWELGKAVKFKVVLEPYSGYRFNSTDTKINIMGRNASLNTKTIKSNKITLSIDYYPTMDLPPVDASTVHFDESNEYMLRWDKVTLRDGSEWKNYEIRIKCNTLGEKSIQTVKITGNKIDLSEYYLDDNIELAIRSVTKDGSSTGKYINSSEWVNIEDSTGSDIGGTKGTFSGYGDKIIFLDESGNSISGWINVGNNWYYMDPSNKNRAVVSSFSFIDGNWYYFNDKGIMQTGWIEYEGYWYYMNPAAGADMGKMCTGWIEVAPGKPQYFMNDGSAQNLPLGAMYADRMTPDGRMTGSSGLAAE